MTTAALSAIPPWPAMRWPRRPGLRGWGFIALIVHGAALWWLANVPLAGPALKPAIKVHLERATVTPPDVLPNAKNTVSGPPSGAAPLPSPATPVVAPQHEPAPVDAAIPSASAAPLQAHDVLQRLSRYRLNGRSQIPPEPALPDRPRALGQLPVVADSARFNRPLPILPFAERPLHLNFYPAGVHGQLVRTMDRLTPEFGFTTSFGLEIKCVYVLVAISCGWREK